MQTTEQHVPATAATHADPATGAGDQANTRAELIWARIRFFEAQRESHLADVAVQRALIHSYAVDPTLPAPERIILTQSAEYVAANSQDQAAHADLRVQELRAQLPRGEAGDVCAIGVVTILRDRIQLTAKLVMGGTRTVSRTWDRLETGTWRSRDPEFIAAEERLGLEFAEWMDSIDVPGRVASMLPRPASEQAAASIEEAREVLRG